MHVIPGPVKQKEGLPLTQEEFQKLYSYCISLGRQLEVEDKTMRKLFDMYGTNTEQVIALAEN